MQIVQYEKGTFLEWQEKWDEPSPFKQNLKASVFYLSLFVVGSLLYWGTLGASFRGGQYEGLFFFGWILLLFNVLPLPFRLAFPKRHWLRVQVDQKAEQVTLVSKGFFHLRKTLFLTLSDISSLHFVMERDSDAKKSSVLVGKLRFEFRNQKARTSSISFGRLEHREEVMEMLMQLSESLQIGRGGILANDPRKLELEFSRIGSQHDYVRPIDVLAELSPQAKTDNATGDEETKELAEAKGVVGQERKSSLLDDIVAEEYDPDKHLFHGTVRLYQPGKQFSYVHKTHVLELVITAFVVGVGSGVVSCVLLLLLTTNGYSVLGLDPTDAVYIGLFGAFLSGLWSARQWQAGKYLPEEWDMSFESKTLSLRKGSTYQTYSMKETSHVLLRLITSTRTSTSTSGGSRSSSTETTYSSVVELVGIPERPSIIVGRTYSSSISTVPYEHGLALAAMLAKQLELPLEFQDE
ncbi:MAG: hypothetical protein EP343_30735 [Deltaproteobacteria bacterium]|nr:MAG: hypothetical protein EP343_30735 [Deltaproteobacteria bacterium]